LFLTVRNDNYFFAFRKECGKLEGKTAPWGASDIVDDRK
jgi:hypothetical protein